MGGWCDGKKETEKRLEFALRNHTIQSAVRLETDASPCGFVRQTLCLSRYSCWHDSTDTM
jgi:hypothetical protein